MCTDLMSFADKHDKHDSEAKLTKMLPKKGLTEFCKRRRAHGVCVSDFTLTLFTLLVEGLLTGTKGDAFVTLFCTFLCVRECIVAVVRTVLFIRSEMADTHSHTHSPPADGMLSQLN